MSLLQLRLEETHNLLIFIPVPQLQLQIPVLLLCLKKKKNVQIFSDFALHLSKELLKEKPKKLYIFVVLFSISLIFIRT